MKKNKTQSAFFGNQQHNKYFIKELWVGKKSKSQIWNWKSKFFV